MAVARSARPNGHWRRLAAWVSGGGSGREARRRARKSEERLRLALEAAGMAIWEMEAASGAMWWSAEAGRLFGMPEWTKAARTRLSHVVQRLHREDRASFQSAVADALARAGEVHRVQSRVVWRDGTIRWIEARGQSWLDSAGHLRGLRGTVVDVTELKRVEEDLRRNLEEVRVLAAVSECAAGAEDEGTVLARTTDCLREAFFPETCGFLLLDAGDGQLHHAESFHTARRSEDLSPVPVGSGAAGSVAASGQACRIDDTRSEPGRVPLVPGMRSEVCVPLRVGARVSGVLDAGSARVGAFSARDEQLLQLVASHVANALERLRSQKALRHSSDLYRAYFTASPLAVFVCDRGGRHLDVNDTAAVLTGYSRGELLRMGILDLMAKKDGGDVEGRLADLLALRTGREEVEIRRKDSSIRHCVVHATAIGPDRVLGFLVDVTDHREAEERLRDSEERYRGLSEAALEAVLVHEGGQIIDVNQAFCELGGYPRDELVGRNAFELIAPEDRERVYRSLLVEHERPYVITAIRRDGTRVPVELRGRSFTFRGQVLRVVALRDISERLRAEAVRESLIGELEAKNAELERFAHTVSHDLKTPLITIRGFVEYLLRDLEAGRAERVAGDARRIAEGAGRMQQLLDHLSELSLVGRGNGAVAPVPLDDVVAEALRRVETRRAGSELRVCLAGGLPVVLGDHARLVQVFQNVLDNAVKFTSGVDEPRVAVEAVPGEPGKATVVVRDNGRGIEACHHQRVFGLFEKLDPQVDGAGFGLAMVKRIVETHGGRARVESEGRNRGTQVWITLPTAPAGGSGADSTTEAPERPEG